MHFNFNFRIFGVPVSFRIGCRFPGYATAAEAELIARERTFQGKDTQINQCDRCGKWHALPVTPSRKLKIIRAQAGRCLDCGKELKEKLTIHHVKPRAEGGRNNIENLVALCRPCHNLRHKTTNTSTRASDNAGKGGKRHIVQVWNKLRREQPHIPNYALKEKLIAAGVIPPEQSNCKVAEEAPAK